MSYLCSYLLCCPITQSSDVIDLAHSDELPHSASDSYDLTEDLLSFDGHADVEQEPNSQFYDNTVTSEHNGVHRQPTAPGVNRNNTTLLSGPTLSIYNSPEMQISESGDDFFDESDQYERDLQMALELQCQDQDASGIYSPSPNQAIRTAQSSMVEQQLERVNRLRAEPHRPTTISFSANSAPSSRTRSRAFQNDLTETEIEQQVLIFLNR